MSNVATQVLLAALLALASTFNHADQILYLDQPEGIALFDIAQFKDDYWSLSRYFVSERYLTYCGIASSVVTLNSLGVESPTSPRLYPYRVFTEDNIFTDPVLRIKAVSAVERSGLTLDELTEVLRVYAGKVARTYASETSLGGFRQSALDALKDRDKRLIVNYLRTAVDQEGGGHISPIAAYERTSDRFLIMDVARYKYPPSWVAAADLFGAMLAPDGSKSRGFVIVSK